VSKKVIKIDLNANAASKNDSVDPSAVTYSELIRWDNEWRHLVICTRK